MSIFGQPDSYSDILKRVFTFTLGVGILCSLALGVSSPELRRFFERSPFEADIGPFKGLKALYVLVPLVIAVFSRMFRLHDRISDFLDIRLTFDTRHIIYLLADRTGVQLSPVARAIIVKTRNDVMRDIFYAYAGFDKDVIDRQLVRTALDSWGWFWVLVEAVCLIALTWTIIIFSGSNGTTTVGVIAAVLLLLLIAFWRICVNAAREEVSAIVADQARRQYIHDYLKKIANAADRPTRAA